MKVKVTKCPSRHDIGLKQQYRVEVKNSWFSLWTYVDGLYANDETEAVAKAKILLEDYRLDYNVVGVYKW